MALEIVTVEEQLKKMRAGYAQELKLKMGNLEIPCRLMNASEEAGIVATAKMRAKSPQPEEKVRFEGLEIQKSILEAGCKVNGTPFASRAFLDQLTGPELDSLYDQYITVVRTANPTLESLSFEQLKDLMESVKKKKVASSELFTWQLAEIGRFFLDRILPTVNEPG